MNQTTDAIAIFGPLWKRKWVILAVGVLVAAGTYLYYRQTTKVFLAETKLFLGASAEEQGTSERGTSKSPKVNATEQATIINSIVVEEVRRRLRAQGTTGDLHGGKVRAKLAVHALAPGQQRLRHGHDLHRHFRPSRRNISLMPRMAWRERLSFSMSAMRTWSSP